MSVDLRVKIAGIEFKNPIFVAAGGQTRDAETILKSGEHGVAAVMTKTIVPQTANDVLPCFVPVEGGFINCVFGSSLSADDWFAREFPMMKKGEAKIIANLAGYFPQQTAEIAAKAEKAGAHMIELPTVCCHMKEILEAMFPDLNMEAPEVLDPKPYAETIKAVKSAVNIPVVAKFSGIFLNNLVEWALAAEEAGIDAIACADAIGPALAIDVKTGEPYLGGPRGVGGLTGKALKPLAMRMVLEASMATKVPVIGVGGISSGEDVIEYLMAGATAVGVTTSGHFDGYKAYKRIIAEVETFMQEHGYSSIAEITGLTHKRLQERKENKTHVITEAKVPEVDEDLCTSCRKCKAPCIYEAISFNGSSCPEFDEKKCFGCGLCVRVCPENALSQNYFTR